MQIAVQYSSTVSTGPPYGIGLASMHLRVCDSSSSSSSSGNSEDEDDFEQQQIPTKDRGQIVTQKKSPPPISVWSKQRFQSETSIQANLFWSDIPL
jgi:hypothetical protein